MTTREFWKDGQLISTEQIVPTKEEIIAEAKFKLGQTDLVALRCLKAGVSYPAEWRQYTETLRAIASGAQVDIPPEPATYPQGT